MLQLCTLTSPSPIHLESKAVGRDNIINRMTYLVTSLTLCSTEIFVSKSLQLRVSSLGCLHGERGHGRGELDSPICITIDTSDTVYVHRQF